MGRGIIRSKFGRVYHGRRSCTHSFQAMRTPCHEGGQFVRRSDTATVCQFGVKGLVSIKKQVWHGARTEGGDEINLSFMYVFSYSVRPTLHHYMEHRFEPTESPSLLCGGPSLTWLGCYTFQSVSILVARKASRAHAVCVWPCIRLSDLETLLLPQHLGLGLLELGLLVLNGDAEQLALETRPYIVKAADASLQTKPKQHIYLHVVSGGLLVASCGTFLFVSYRFVSFRIARFFARVTSWLFASCFRWSD